MSETAFQAKPWEQPIWKPARGQAGAFAFLVIVHVLAVVGLILFPLPGWGPVLGAAALACTEAKAAGGDSVRVFVSAGGYEELAG